MREREFLSKVFDIKKKVSLLIPSHWYFLFYQLQQIHGNKKVMLSFFEAYWFLFSMESGWSIELGKSKHFDLWKENVRIIFQNLDFYLMAFQRSSSKNLDSNFWAMHVNFQVSSFTGVGGEWGDKRTCDVTPHLYTKYLNSPLTWRIKKCNPPQPEIRLQVFGQTALRCYRLAYSRPDTLAPLGWVLPYSLFYQACGLSDLLTPLRWVVAYAVSGWPATVL